MMKCRGMGKMKPVTFKKGGKTVPFYAADGVGKMNMGGSVMKYKTGGVTRGDGICTQGRTNCKMR